MSIVTLQAYRGYQDIGTVGQSTAQLAGNVQSINQILDVGLMNTRDLLHGFVRVEHLVGLGLATLINTNQLQSSGAGGGGTTLTASDSVVITANNITLVNDTATPGDLFYYGTNGSGTLGWYALSSGGTGTVTSVALADGSSTAIYSITGSPVTSSGTLTFSLKTQSANEVFVGPTTGSPAQPTFRSLVAGDVPTLNQNTTGTAGGLTGGVADSVVISGGFVELSGDASTPGNTYYYGTNGAGTKGWYALSSGGLGTVTSVALADGSTTPIYTISGSPVTGSGTLTFTLATQSATYALLGPASGAAAQPAFRAIANADLPIYLTESAGWNSSSGAIQLALTVAQDILIPYAGTLKEVVILTQGGSGSCTVTLSKCTLGTFPGSLTDITGGTPPAISSSASPYTNTALSGWTIAFSQNDVVRATLTANTNFTSVKIILRMQ